MPKIILNREPTQATITVVDWDGGTVFLERSPDFLDLFAEVATFQAESYIDLGLDVDLRYKWRISLNDLSGSVLITEDNTGLVPPYYVAEPVAPATFSNINVGFVIPWTADITIPLIRITNLRRTKHSRIRLST